MINPISIYVLSILCLSPSIALASDDYFASEWSEKCSLDEHVLTIMFKSISGDSSNDDMATTLTTNELESFELSIPKALYAKSGLHSNEHNLCAEDKYGNSKLAAVKINNESILLWLSKDNRPSFNTLSLALINIKTGKLLDFIDTNKMQKPSDYHQRWIIMKDVDVFKVRLVGEWLDIDDSADSAIETWMRVSIQENKIIFQEN